MPDANLRFSHRLGLFSGFRIEASRGRNKASGGGLTHSGEDPLLEDGSSLHQKTASVPESEALIRENLPDSMRSLIEKKPEFWEFLFLQDGLNYVLQKATPDWERALKFGMDESIFGAWLLHKLDLLAFDIDRLDRLWNTDLKVALGPPYVPTDVGKMCSFFADVSAVVEDLIGWEEEMGALMDHPIYGGIASYIGGESRFLLEGLLSFKKQLDQAIPRFPEGGTFELVFPIHLPADWANLGPRAIKSLLAESSELRGVASGRVNVARGANPLGSFGLRSILENLEAGIFLEDDLYWSTHQNAWRPIKGLKKSALAGPKKT